MPIDFSGKWHNQHASEMNLTINSHGRVIGKYATGVGAPTPSEQFDLVGFVSGDLIVFSVDFGKYDSMTSWSGQLTLDKDGREKVETLWHLAKNIPDSEEPQKLWAAIWSGCDTFYRGPHPTGESDVTKLPSHPLAPKKNKS